MVSSSEAAAVQPRVSYSDLPHKISLIVLMLARTTEPLAISAIQSCIFFQLRHFSPSADSAVISSQAGLLVSCRTIAHVCTGVLWGQLADSKYGGRKPVLVTGLLSCGIGVLGYGFSRSFKHALIWQVLDGAMNSSVPILRCMTSELYPEKRYLARSLTLLPLSTSLGMSLGPILGGFLATDFQTCTSKKFTCMYPFAVPSMVIAGYCIVVALLAVLILQENPYNTCSADESPKIIASSRQGLRDVASAPSSTTTTDEAAPLLRSYKGVKSSTTPVTATSSSERDQNIESTTNQPSRRLWTGQVVYTMIATFFIAGHLGVFSILWPIFLSAPYQTSDNPHTLINLSGGLGMSSRQVAACMSLLGLPSIALQITIYPNLNDRFGAVAVWRKALWCFPIAYAVAPFATLAVYTSRTTHTVAAYTPLLWTMVVFVLLLFIVGRTGVTPATTMLINACTPYPQVRGTVHTIGTTVAGLGRSAFPAIVLPIFGYGLKNGVTGLGLWCLAALSGLTCVFSRRVTAGGGIRKGVV